MTSRRAAAALAGLTIEAPPAPAAPTRHGQQSGRLPLDRIVPNPDQPRKHFEKADILRLAADIDEHGQQSPIKVMAPAQDGRHMIVFGERRWRALAALGRETADVIIDFEIADAETAFDQAFAENIQREDLTRAEVAAALVSRKTRYGLTNADLAKRYSKSEAWIEQHVRYGQLSVDARTQMDERGISLQVATVIDRFTEDEQLELLSGIPAGSTRDDQLAYLRTTRELRVGGTDQAAAETLAASLHLVGADAAQPPSVGADPGPSRSRPRVVSFPFAVEEVRGGPDQVLVNVTALATVRLLHTSKGRPVGPRRWLEAIRADLVEYANFCEATGLASEWLLVEELLGGIAASPPTE